MWEACWRLAEELVNCELEGHHGRISRLRAETGNYGEKVGLMAKERWEGWTCMVQVRA